MSAHYVLADNVVAVHTQERVVVTRVVANGSTRVFQSSCPDVALLLAWFRRPSTIDSWVQQVEETGRAQARRLLQVLMDGEILAESEVSPVQRRHDADGLDAVLQSLATTTQQLRADAMVLGDGWQAEDNALVHACQHLLERVRARAEAAVESEQRRKLPALAAAMTQGVRLHLGCGDHRLPGWINIDLRGGDLPVDIRRSLALTSGSVKAVYLAHLLEHLEYKDEALATLRELHRVLEAGGLVRLVVPDMGSFLQAYAADDRAFFECFERRWERPPSATLLASFLHYAGAGSFPHVLDRHRFGYDSPTLTALLLEAGFRAPRICVAGDSAIDEPGLDYSWACRETANGRAFSLIMEARA
jgi:hypothetical protein